MLDAGRRGWVGVGCDGLWGVVGGCGLWVVGSLVYILGWPSGGSFA